MTSTDGRCGQTLNTGAKTTSPVSPDEATKVFHRLIASKRAKGYHYSGATAGQDKP